jgi:hypothetical protein
MKTRFGAPLLLLTIAASVQAANPAPPPKKTPSPAASSASGAPCSAAEFHQFDFWIGEWEVTTPEGKPAGTSRVSAVLGGCALQENWTSATGGKTTSLSVYDEPNRRWHQTSVDDRGGLLQIDGEFRDGRMVLAGRRPALKNRGGTIVHRISWTAVSPDRVQQRWEASNNEGRTWTTVFEGTYARKK